MERTEFILYVIILGLVVNLAANMVWKYIPGTDKHIDMIVSFALIFVCVLFVIFTKGKGQTDSRTEPLPLDAQGSTSQPQQSVNVKNV